MINSLQPPIPPAGASLQIVPTAGASLQLVPNSEFSLHPHAALLRTAPPLFWRGGTGVRTPLAQACSLCPIQNTQFSPRPTCPICPTRLTIQNSQFKMRYTLWQTFRVCQSF